MTSERVCGKYLDKELDFITLNLFQQIVEASRALPKSFARINSLEHQNSILDCSQL